MIMPFDPRLRAEEVGKKVLRGLFSVYSRDKRYAHRREG